MRKLLSFFVLVLIGLTMFAQAPQRFTYQAVVRNESNTLVRGTVGVRISILQGGANGTMVYQETHTAVTNVNGLMTLEIGGGTVVNGDFASIDWANGPFFLKTEIDPTGGTYYVLENVQQLLSVPYALYAGSAANSFSGNYNDLTNTPDIPQIPENVSAFNNDAGYITMDSIPEIPTVPTNVSAFVNDAGYVTQSTLNTENYITQNDLITNNYVTEADIPTNVSAFNNDAGYITMDSIPEIPTVPTNVSAFVNDAGYVTESTLTTENYITQNDLITNNYVTEADIPTNVSAFTNDAGYITMDSIPVIPTVPTNVSAFVNDAGYVTQSTLTTENYITQNDLITNNYVTEADIPTNVSAFNNDAGYITMDSIPDIPTVPTNVSAFVNDAGYLTTATVQEAANIPTNVSAFANDANYITLAQVPEQVNADWNATSGAAQIMNKPTLFDGDYNSLANRPELFSGDYNDLTNKPQIPQIPANVSAFNNDAGYVTESMLTTNNYITQNDLITNNYVTEADIPTNVSAFTNDANYITAADVPAIPTNVSAFTNDAGYITMDSIPEIPAVPTNISAFVNDAGYLTTATVQEAANIPTNVSAFTNDANYITAADVPAIPTNVSAFENDANYITSADVPTIPTNVSAFNNDANYITSEDIPAYQVLSISNDTIYLSNGGYAVLPAGFDGNYNSLTNKPELFSGDYNDLTNRPAIPSVPTNVSAFTNDANYITSADVPAIPTNVSSFTNDAGYITMDSIPAIPTVPTNVSSFTNDANYITSADVPAIPTNVSAFTNDAGYLTEYTEQQVLSISNDTIYLTGGSFAKLPAGFSGSYNDLTDKPTIPTVPTNVGAFENDRGYLTEAHLDRILDSLYHLIDSIQTSSVQLNNPQIITNPISYYTSDRAQVSGYVASEGNTPVISYGLCYGTYPHPTISDFYVYGGEGVGSVSCTILDLEPATTYFFRAYATNANGTFYGNEISITTASNSFNCGDCIADIDDNLYHTIQIGSQCWMKENLRAKGANTVSIISLNVNGTIYYPNNDPSSKDVLGYLYSRQFVSNSLCPAGWHVPSRAECQNLVDYATLSSGEYNAKSLAAAGLWESSDVENAIGNHIEYNNTTGFSALPTGSCHTGWHSCQQGSGGYDDVTFFWTSDITIPDTPTNSSSTYTAYTLRFTKDSNTISCSSMAIGSYSNMYASCSSSGSQNFGSIRCIKD